MEKVAFNIMYLLMFGLLGAVLIDVFQQSFYQAGLTPAHIAKGVSASTAWPFLWPFL